MSSRRHSAGPRALAYVGAVVLAAGVVVTRTVLLALEGVDALSELPLSDPVWPALAVLLGLLLGPYVKEVQAVGARVVTRDVLPRDTGGELAAYAAEDDLVRADAEGQDADLAAARYLGLELAMAGAVPVFPELEDLRLHLYVPDDDGRLVPVLEHDDPVEAWARGWDPGTGVVGRAYSRCRTQVGRGEALRQEGYASRGGQHAFDDLEAVVAVPLLNLAGSPVGVLSAASDGEPDPEDPAVRTSLEALASGVARVLVDLAAWGTDEAVPGAPAPRGGG